MGTTEAEESKGPDLWQNEEQSLTNCTLAAGLMAMQTGTHTQNTDVYALTYRNT